MIRFEGRDGHAGSDVVFSDVVFVAADFAVSILSPVAYAPTRLGVPEQRFVHPPIRGGKQRIYSNRGKRVGWVWPVWRPSDEPADGFTRGWERRTFFALSALDIVRGEERRVRILERNRGDEGGFD
jgi:hypothetical protein